jgi:alanyl-tRNA synthetase
MDGSKTTVVEGSRAAELYTTYGVPPELLEQLAAERNFAFDWEGFRRAMQAHGDTSGAGQIEVFKHGPIESLKKALHETPFLGYETTEAEVEVKGVVAQNKLCDELSEVGHQQPIVLVLDRSPFYAEAGGQVGDVGEIVGKGFRFEVTDTQKDSGLILHYGHLRQGKVRIGEKATAKVHAERRQGIRRAHSATHILHYALQRNLGGHAQQQGSKVDEDWLRFDFTNLSQVTTEQLAAIERDVRERVKAGDRVRWDTVPLAEARKAGAMMLFGEKYPDPVRMVSMGAFSKELCGGTHLENTREVGAFEIIAEEPVSAGVRRVVALTGRKAQEQMQRTEQTLCQAAERLGVAPAQVPEGVRHLMDEVRGLKKQIAGGGKAAPAEPLGKAAPSELSYDEQKAALRDAARTLNVGMFDVPARIAALQDEIKSLQTQLAELAKSGQLSADALLERAEEVGGVKTVIAETPGANPNLMRQWIDQLRKKASPIAVLLAARQADDKALVVAGVSHELITRGADAGRWAGETAKVMGGGGGGKPDMAQAGGKDATKLPEALDRAREVIRGMLA